MESLVAPNPFKRLACFGGLTADVAESLRHYLRDKSYSRGEVIFVEGEPCPGLFVVKSGAVKLYKTSIGGEEHIVKIVRQGGCFECAPLFDKGPNPVSAEALEATELHLLPAAVFHTLVRTHPEVALDMAAVLAMRLRSLIGIVEDLSFRPAGSRLANLLLQLAEPHGEVLVVSPSQPLHQHHLACMLGCSRQMVNTWLRKMVKAGIIRMQGRRIVVLRPSDLKEMASPGRGGRSLESRP